MLKKILFTLIVSMGFLTTSAFGKDCLEVPFQNTDFETQFFYEDFVEGLRQEGVEIFAIYEDDFKVGPFKIIVSLDYNRACAKIKAGGNTLAKGCVNVSRTGTGIVAEVELITVNSGVWRLDHPTLHFEHDFATNSGRIGFSGKKKEYVCFPCRYKTRETYDNDTKFRW